MTDPQVPLDLENQLAPQGHFPGTAETLATPVGSDREVRVPIGQKRNRHLQLSKAEFRARSEKQREIDALADGEAEPTQDPQTTRLATEGPPSLPNPAPKKRGRPSGRRGKALRVAPKDPPIGQPSPAPSTTAAPTAAPIPGSFAPVDEPALSNHALESRILRIERGMDMIVRALAERDERQEQVSNDDHTGYHGVDYGGTGIPAQDASEAFAELDEELEDDLDELGAEPEPMVVTDVDHKAKTVSVVAAPAAAEPEWDKGMQALQQMIVKRNPLKVFRLNWAGLTRTAQYNEWSPERREAFDEVFNSMVAHPKFIHQMSKFLRSSRNGSCIGNEQIARVCGQVAGFLTVYQLAAAGR